MVAVSPCFPALLPTVIQARLRRIPWVLWLQDLLPDGATATGLMERGVLLSLARSLERVAYDSANHIVVISDTFKENLARKGVPGSKMTRIYNWPTRPPSPCTSAPTAHQGARVLCMGNIGHSQGLPAVVRAFEDHAQLAERDVRFVIAGAGVAEDEVRRAITTDRVELTGLLFGERLDSEIRSATIGAVTQHYEGVEFNVPSKLMNYMAFGLPVVASVRLDSEVARIIENSGAGWVTDAERPASFAQKISEILEDPVELTRRGEAGAAFAEQELSAERAARLSDGIIRRLVAR
jgi:colanic acid biosynthesis glycosyl transferase WcaI